MKKLLVENLRQIKSNIVKKTEVGAAKKLGMISAQELNDKIYDSIQKSFPFLAGKVGSNELLVCLWHLKWRLWTRLGIKLSWNRTQYLEVGAGIFPWTPESYHKYATAFMTALGDIDNLGIWHNEGEMKLVSAFAPQAKIGYFHGLEPYLVSDKPWSQALENKTVLVVTSFAETLTKQIPKLSNVWIKYEDKNGQTLIPKSTKFTIVKFPYGFDPEIQEKYGSWENILATVMAEIKQQNFDIALLGCGGYSLLLGTKIKKMGKLAIHLGGATQILFGIRGSRWEEKPWFLENINDYWTYPLAEDKPGKKAMENRARLIHKPNDLACYW
ncbi:MAG: hypothetical protein F6K22_34275 [Okeania sp. SIO2F4]|uniref:hypothetical protein n=1 Tax=Okeania sp. SIO2F4 TaxID=2607790 RepID=UPI0014299698|nr:hypothetical protein [Okeania sp. SIO2F4]NES07418.1 hypothetical protein [Okeania sp. SIO2F4]